MAEDLFLLSEFKKTLRKNAKSNFVDFDIQFRHKFDFIIQKFEDVLKNTNRCIPPNRWSYHRIALVRKGHGDFITGIYKFRAKKNTLVVIPSRVVCHAVANPTRRAIIHLIASQSNNINSIAEKFGVSRQAISLHVKILIDCGLIEGRQQG